MGKSNWIPMEKINDVDKIWAGTKVRLYNVGLNVKDKKDDYYDYLVSYIYENDEYLQLTNISQGKAGYFICVLQKELPNHYALGKTLKNMMGIEDTFVRFEFN
ncbi:hypothetical protein [Gottfriedia acidiceleris]|uniref:hypothetical protein n=1 Tax=Gottfriedia acidiceleris TaxID=371036 RepID=UPI002FFE5AD1